MRRYSLPFFLFLGLCPVTHAADRADTSAALQERARDHGIDGWLKVAQLDRNPYLWTGRRVALVVRLRRMLDPSNALVQQLGQSDGPAIVLGGVTPDTFRRETVVVIATVDEERVPLRGFDLPLASATFLAALPCSDDACEDLLASDVAWGRATGER